MIYANTNNRFGGFKVKANESATEPSHKPAFHLFIRQAQPNQHDRTNPKHAPNLSFMSESSVEPSGIPKRPKSSQSGSTAATLKTKAKGKALDRTADSEDSNGRKKRSQTNSHTEGSVVGKLDFDSEDLNRSCHLYSKSIADTANSQAHSHDKQQPVTSPQTRQSSSKNGGRPRTQNQKAKQRPPNVPLLRVARAKDDSPDDTLFSRVVVSSLEAGSPFDAANRLKGERQKTDQHRLSANVF